MAQCPGLVTSIAGFAGKRHETTQVGHTTNGRFLCSGELAGPAVFHHRLLDVIVHYPQWLSQTISNLYSQQNFVLILFSLPSSNTYASATMSEQMTPTSSVIGLNLSF